jgi:tetratricopeptide (TPR) repeat protein
VQRDQLVRRFEQGVAAYEAGRFDEAFRLAKLVGNRAPGIEAVDEVAGLAAYRLGRWREATRYLEGYIERSGDQDQIPVLMDCYRGLGRTAKVGGLWRDLRRLSPGREVLAEARIVAAGALADSGDLSGAISILSAGAVTRSLRNPAGRHLRQWYALADLYERAGDVPRARELFARVARADPEAFDVQSRLQSLGGGPRRTARSAGRR